MPKIESGSDSDSDDGQGIHTGIHTGGGGGGAESTPAQPKVQLKKKPAAAPWAKGSVVVAHGLVCPRRRHRRRRRRRHCRRAPQGVAWAEPAGGGQVSRGDLNGQTGMVMGFVRRLAWPRL
eukprot:SAG11_NODE_4877_length_1737_cov_1.811355_2_plen_121_part_00